MSTCAPGSGSGGPVRVALTILGCKVNYAEMADLAGDLAAAGCEVVPDDQPADIRVLNSCTVTVAADATTRQRLHRLRRDDPSAHLVVTGCSVDGNPHTYLTRDSIGQRIVPEGVDAVFSNAEKGDLADHVLRLAAARRVGPAPAMAAPLRTRAFIKVQDGCDHRCTYCSVWRARGASRSVPLTEVLRRAAGAVANGHRELVLTGVDLGSYGRGDGYSLAELLTALLDEVGDGARVRLSSINTNDITAALLELNAHPQLCSHWHMPLQSGSDAVLKAMHRGYRRRQYLRVCAQLRALDPNTEFTSDIMVGFPGETEHDHAETVALVEETAMLSAHVFRWSARPDTAASALPGRVDDALARRRSSEVRRAATRAGGGRHQRALGQRHAVLWERVEDGTATGFAATYLAVAAAASAATVAGAVSPVVADAVDGDHLHAIVADATLATP